MLERRSALASAKPYRSSILKIEEAPLQSLIQVSGGSAPTSGTVFRIASNQYWVIDAEAKSSGVLTPLNSSRTRILLEGLPARDVLAKGIALDFHAGAFRPGDYAMTGVHHMPVLIHCMGETAFHIYAMRTFAMSVWEWLTDAAAEFDGVQ